MSQLAIESPERLCSTKVWAAQGQELAARRETEQDVEQTDLLLPLAVPVYAVPKCRLNHSLAPGCLGFDLQKQS